MPRIKRGETIRISVKLSGKTLKRLGDTSDNLNVSRASLIMFALNKQLEKGITKEQLLNLQNKIELHDHLAIRIPVQLSEKINGYTERFDIRKNALVGLLVSDYYDNLPGKAPKEKVELHQLLVDVNELLTEKVMNYSEEKHLPLNMIMEQALENGAYDGIPQFPTDKKESFLTNVPLYIWEQAHEEAAALGVPLHFYLELCLYKAFLSENKIF